MIDKNLDRAIRQQNDRILNTWSDAARAAALEARKNGAHGLASKIGAEHTMSQGNETRSVHYFNHPNPEEGTKKLSDTLAHEGYSGIKSSSSSHTGIHEGRVESTKDGVNHTFLLRGKDDAQITGNRKSGHSLPT